MKRRMMATTVLQLISYSSDKNSKKKDLLTCFVQFLMNTFWRKKNPTFLVFFFVHTVKSVFLTVSVFLLGFFLVFKHYIIDRSLTDV